MPLSMTSLKLDAAVKERVQKLAESRRRSANWLMGEAIREFVDREEARAQLDRDTLEAWEEYVRTGKSISDEAADAWLAQLEAGEDAEPPQPE
jgi:predicted transcriptional regulator